MRGYPLESMDVAVNFPGAHLADGLSAGAAIAVAIASCIDRRPVRADFAITGEISLTGEILPVGGMQAKIEAAVRCGISNVIAPQYKGKNPPGMLISSAATFEDAYRLMTCGSESRMKSG